MANLQAIHAVGNSLVTYLRHVYPEALRHDHDCTFSLVSSQELNQLETPPLTLTLYLYRVTMNEHVRNSRPLQQPSDTLPPLALDLHYLLTVWANNALEEQLVLTWALRELYLHSVLDRSSLSPEAGWTAADTIQLIPAELSNEDLMRIWNALTPPYHLSVSYIARVVRIDPDVIESGRPVVARRFSHGEQEGLG